MLSAAGGRLSPCSRIRPLVLVAWISASACISVPARYQAPVTRYRPVTARTIAIEGFTVGSLQPTGYTTTTNVGSAFAGGTSGLYVGSGVAEHEQYVFSSEAETFRALLANTGCFRVVAPGSPSDLVLVGQVNSVPNMGWTIPAQFLEGLTLTPIFGVPVPMRGTGEASANIYDHTSGELVSSVSTGKIPLTGWTTIYTGHQDGQRGLATLRGMAMHDLAERLAQATCGEK